MRYTDNSFGALRGEKIYPAWGAGKPPIEIDALHEATGCDGTWAYNCTVFKKVPGGEWLPVSGGTHTVYFVVLENQGI